MTVANPREVPEYELNPSELQVRKCDGISKVWFYSLYVNYACLGEVLRASLNLNYDLLVSDAFLSLLFTIILIIHPSLFWNWFCWYLARSSRRQDALPGHLSGYALLSSAHIVTDKGRLSSIPLTRFMDFRD